MSDAVVSDVVVTGVAVSSDAMPGVATSSAAPPGPTPPDAVTEHPEPTPLRWVGAAIQRLGETARLGQIMVGLVCGFSLSFWRAAGVIVASAVICEIVAIALGLAARRGDKDLAGLARASLGRRGAAALGALIAVGLTGWFGIWVGLAGAGLAALVPAVPVWAWAVVIGLVLGAAALARAERWRALWAGIVVVFLVVMAGQCLIGVYGGSLSALMRTPPVGPPLSLLAALAMAVGVYGWGALSSPDLARQAQSAADVVKPIVTGVTLGQVGAGMAGVILARLTGVGDIIAATRHAAGAVGVVVVVLMAATLGLWALTGHRQSASWATTALGDRQPSTWLMTVVASLIGTALAALGLLTWMAAFLTTLAILTLLATAALLLGRAWSKPPTPPNP